MSVTTEQHELMRPGEPTSTDGANKSTVATCVTGSRFFLLWALVASIAVGVCALSWPSAHLAANKAVGIEAEYLPVSIDSFYHARRILDTVADPASFYQFDTKIHAPEGSLLPWPWGYDYAMAWIVRMLKNLGVPGPPIAILIWIPVAGVLLSVGLVLQLARELRLSTWSVTLAGLAVAVSPLTQLLHGPGIVDHHYAEYIFVLAALLFGLKWLSVPADTRAALGLGMVLGIAPAVHNGLFILQLPLLATLAALWLQGVRVPRRQAVCFGVCLVVTTVLVLIPSLAFRLGKFEFYTLSWFHLYVATGTVLVTLSLTLTHRSRRSIGWLVALGMVLLAPLVAQFVLAQSFLTGTITRLDGISEMKSPLRIARQTGLWGVSEPYSMLIWILPVTAAYCALCAWRERTSGRLIFWITALFGLALLLMQFRLHYFGSFAIVLPLLVLVERIANLRVASHKLIMLVASLLLLVAYWPPLQFALRGHNVSAGDANFAALRPILGTLQRACDRDPGIVLADNDAGHYIRYYTKCSVIANNFLLTRQHEQKIDEIDFLTSLSAEELVRRAPYVKYILLRPLTIFRRENGDATYMTYSPKSGQLFNDLLVNQARAVPPAYRLLDQASIGATGETPIPYIRLYAKESGSRAGSVAK